MSDSPRTKKQKMSEAFLVKCEDVVETPHFMVLPDKLADAFESSETPISGIAVDIESSGACIGINGPKGLAHTNEVVSIGITGVKYNKERRALVTDFKTRITPPFSDDRFEKRCFEEYWSTPDQAKQLEQFKAERNSFVSAEAAFESFVGIMERKIEQYGKVALFSDFPDFDAGILSMNVCALLQRPGLWYMPNKTGKMSYFGGFLDTGSMAKALDNAPDRMTKNWSSTTAVLKQNGVVISDMIQHTHLPEDDAEHICYSGMCLLALGGGK
jgi:hypothetical protein